MKKTESKEEHAYEEEFENFEELSSKQKLSERNNQQASSRKNSELKSNVKSNSY